MIDRTQALEDKAERSRSRVSRLLDDLQDQTSPVEVLNQLLGHKNGEGSDLTRTIVEQVIRNPLPCILIATGIGWLIASERGTSPSRKSGPRKRTPKREKR